VYLTHGEHHLVVRPGLTLDIDKAPPRSFHRPSIDVLFESSAASAAERQLVAVLLTGMGSDGAQG
jgi:two-component system chemotaxis response regulator CheB